MPPVQTLTGDGWPVMLVGVLIIYLPLTLTKVVMIAVAALAVMSLMLYLTPPRKVTEAAMAQIDRVEDIV